MYKRTKTTLILGLIVEVLAFFLGAYFDLGNEFIVAVSVVMVIVTVVVILADAASEKDSEKSSNIKKNTITTQTKTLDTTEKDSTSVKTSSNPTPKQKPIEKKVIPPTGRNLSWNSTADICFALGAFMAGVEAGSSWIGFYENRTMIFNIRNFYFSFDESYEKVPPDVVKFLSSNPSILSTVRYYNGRMLYRIEFERTFSFDTPDAPDISENRKKAISNIMKIVQSNLTEGANKTIELTKSGKQLSFKIEEIPFCDSKNLWINRN